GTPSPPCCRGGPPRVLAGRVRSGRAKSPHGRPRCRRTRATTTGGRRREALWRRRLRGPGAARGAWSHGLGSEQAADLSGLVRRPAEQELVLLRGGEVAVRLAVEVDPDTTVHVHGRVCDPVPGVGGPQLRDRDLLVGGKPFLETPG